MYNISREKTLHVKYFMQTNTPTPLLRKRIIRIERGKCCAYKKIILKLHAKISGK